MFYTDVEARAVEVQAVVVLEWWSQSSSKLEGFIRFEGVEA